jgi:hypothetical protein
MKSGSPRSFLVLQWSPLSSSNYGEGNDIYKGSNPAPLTICNYWGMQMAGEPTHRCVGFMLGRALGVIFACMRSTHIIREWRAGKSQLADRGPHLTTGTYVFGKAGVEKTTIRDRFCPAHGACNIIFSLYTLFFFSSNPVTCFTWESKKSVSGDLCSIGLSFRSFISTLFMKYVPAEHL